MSENETSVEKKSRQISHRLHPPLNESQAAEILGLSVQTLRNWRHLRKGPAYRKLSPGPRGRVVYFPDELQDYLDRCRIDPEA